MSLPSATPDATTATGGVGAGSVPATLAELMQTALAIEIEAAQRYAELADVMETHNNPEVAALFRRMMEIEGRHADTIRAELGGQYSPLSVVMASEAPETAPLDDVHYLMLPYHALAIALAAEERALRFFTELAQVATVESVRAAAQLLADEEREHVELVRQWMAKVPAPDANWAVDPDPPRYVD